MTNGLEQVIADQTLMHARVFGLYEGKGGEAPYLNLQVAFTTGFTGSMQGIMHKEECDLDEELSSVEFLVGQSIRVILLGTDAEGRLICSRKAAQKKLLDRYREDFQSGKEFSGIVTGLTGFGGFVDVKGVTGKLRNLDFSADYTPLNECYTFGDTIRVRLKEFPPGEYSKPVWEACRKYTRQTPFLWDVKPGEMVVGTILSCQNFPSGPAAFVRVKDAAQKSSLDILCAIPPDVELYRNAGAVVRISSVEAARQPSERPRVRGRIVRVM